MDTALLWSCSCVTSSSMPQLLKNSTLARSRTRRCLVAYNLHGCSVREGELWEKARTLEWYSHTLRCSNNAVIYSHCWWITNKQTKNTMSKVKHSLDRSWTNDSVMLQMLMFRIIWIQETAFPVSIFLFIPPCYGCGSYISSSSEDLGQDHSGQTISAVVQCGYSKLQHGILILHRAQIQQAAEAEIKELICQSNRHLWLEQWGVLQVNTMWDCFL